MTWDARKIITRIPEASGRTGRYAASGRKFVLADVHRITGRHIRNGDATLQGMANTLSQCSSVLSTIVPDLQDYWYDY